MKQELIDKYNVSVPRYTSYPPANFFRPFTGEEFLKEVDYSNEVREKNLSFYFHMPFCRNKLYVGVCVIIVAATLTLWQRKSMSKPMYKHCIRR